MKTNKLKVGLRYRQNDCTGRSKFINHLFFQAGITRGHLIVFFFLTMGMGQLHAQEPGPIQPTGYLDRSEVILVWDAEVADNDVKVLERNMRLNFQYQNDALGGRLYDVDTDTSDNISSGSKKIDIINGDFNDDGNAEYLYMSTGKDDVIQLTLAYKDNSSAYNRRTNYTLNGKVVGGKNLSFGDLNGDSMAEFAVCYTENDTDVNVAIFTIDENFQLQWVETIYKVFVIDYTYAFVEALTEFGDLIGDGDDELIVGNKQLANGSIYRLSAYDFDNNLNLEGAIANILEVPKDFEDYLSVAMTAVDYNADGQDEVVLAFGTYNTGDGDTYLIACKFTSDLTSVTFFDDGAFSGRYSKGEYHPLLLKSGDLNGDGVAEILLGTRGGIEFFSVSPDHKLTNLNVGSDTNFENIVGLQGDRFITSSPNYFEVADITGDGSDDILLAEMIERSPDDDIHYSFHVSLFAYDQSFNETAIERLVDYEPVLKDSPFGIRPNFAITIADYDEDVFRIGSYTSYRCWNEVARPICILNTPPIHIDYIDGALHDVSECYGQNDCKSIVRKFTENVQSGSFGLETSQKGDWGYQPTLKVAGMDMLSVFGPDLKDVVTDETTTQIGKTTNTSTFQTASMDARSSRDDAILTTLNNYEQWIYPIYGVEDELLGELNIVIPETSDPEVWLMGKQSLDIAGIIPTHEAGNLLSYRKFYSAEEIKANNPDIAELIFIGQDHQLVVDGSYEEHISWGNSFSTESVSSTSRVETNFKIGFDLFTPGLYSLEDKSVGESERITSQIIEVGENFGIEVHGESLASDTYIYSVRPYFYWSKNGALTVDYMVDLSEGSFWSENYQTQDPGFILPNRLDSMKVKNEMDKITDMDEYNKTSSIYFNPSVFLPGDTVTITAIIHNFSISATSQNVEVSFYDGDPDKGALLLTDIKGNSVFTTDGPVEDQHFAKVSMSWIADFEQKDRIYGMIDPMDKLTENRENNNVAWAPVLRFAPNCDDDGAGTVTSTESGNPFKSGDSANKLLIYPNPASHCFAFNYNGPAFDQAMLTITDISGKVARSRKINYTQSNELIKMDISDLQQGAYVVTLNGATFRYHSKLMVY